MKKFRIFLAAIAFVVAIGGAVAAQMVALVPGYIFIPASGSTPAQCMSPRLCDNAGTVNCTYVDEDGNSFILRKDNSPTTSCGQVQKDRVN